MKLGIWINFVATNNYLLLQVISNSCKKIENNNRCCVFGNFVAKQYGFIVKNATICIIIIIKIKSLKPKFERGVTFGKW